LRSHASVGRFRLGAAGGWRLTTLAIALALLATLARPGYRLTVVRVDGDRAGEYETFTDGWLGSDNEPLGRPGDLVVMPDGSLLVSADTANAIYRITYDGWRSVLVVS
jgi:glucose/arabinose dehydrogenase